MNDNMLVVDRVHRLDTSINIINNQSVSDVVAIPAGTQKQRVALGIQQR